MKLKLKKDVGLLGAVMYGVGIILGAGVYALVGEATALAGNSLWLSFLSAAVVSGFTGLSYMELVSMFQKSAAEYTYVKNSFKSRILAFNVGWVELFADTIAASAVALGFGNYFFAMFGIHPIITALGILLVMSFVNFWGMKVSVRMNFVMTLIEIAGLIGIILLAVAFGKFGTVNYMEMPYGIGGTLSAAALIFFAYIGFEDLANISEEVKDGKKNVPKALMYSVIITSIIYVLIGISVVSIMDWQSLAASEAPLASVAASLLGNQAFAIWGAIALFATANTILISLIVSSRMMYGMGKDGSLPKILSRVHPKRRTPHVAILASMLLAMGFVLMGNIKTVASITDLGTFYIFIFVNASVILLRYRMPKAKRGFKTPLNIGRFPVIPFLGMLSSFALLTHLNMDAIMIGLVAIGVGIVFYLVFNHGKVSAKTRKRKK
jgi:APA family basic amino acid/polyamine antiporter